MAELRAQFRAIIFGITGVIVAFLIFRFIVDLINAPTSNVLVGLIHSITDILILPFAGIIILPPTGMPATINIDSLLAMGGYVLIAILFTEVVTAFLYPSASDVIQNLVNSIFRFIEFTLVLRIVFELFAIIDVTSSSSFVKAIYGLTIWSQGILFRFPFGNGYINLSAILALIIVVILDSVTGSFIKSMAINSKQVTTTTKTTNNVPLTPPWRPVPQALPVQAAPIQQPQNITINIPLPQMQVGAQTPIQQIFIPVPMPVQPGAVQPGAILPTRVVPILPPPKQYIDSNPVN